MAFAITAELPLGTYRGAAADGSVDPCPSVSRLYSALLCAAGFGPRAVESDRGLAPCDADTVALRWLEDNPPDLVSIPSLHVNRGRTTAYRDDGTLKKTSGSLGTKKLPKAPDAGVAVAGAFTWSWSQTPPPGVATALQSLCQEVSHLGTAETPVRLAAQALDEAIGTHSLDPEASLFSTGGGHDLEVPLTGRLDELAAMHAAASGAAPTTARDKWRTDESSVSAIPTRERVALARYVAVDEPDDDSVPWPGALLIPVEAPPAVPRRSGAGADLPSGPLVRERDTVRTAVRLHRALIQAVGAGAPPLLTGVYPGGMPRPANHLAIHVLTAAMPCDLQGAAAALLLLAPRGADVADVQVVDEAVRSLRTLRGPRGELWQLGTPRRVSGARFWQAAAPGTRRVWELAVPGVPDTRGDGTQEWTFADAALLSLGFVLRDVLGPFPGRGESRQRAVVAAVRAAGVQVESAQPLRVTDVRPYVHAVNSHAVVRPYRATISLGHALPERAVVAIGQSRHLGGGLLVPRDVEHTADDGEADR